MVLTVFESLMFSQWSAQRTLPKLTGDEVAFGNSQHFIDAGFSQQHFTPTALAKGAHAVLETVFANLPG